MCEGFGPCIFYRCLMTVDVLGALQSPSGHGLSVASCSLSARAHFPFLQGAHIFGQLRVQDRQRQEADAGQHYVQSRRGHFLQAVPDGFESGVGRGWISCSRGGDGSSCRRGRSSRRGFWIEAVPSWPVPQPVQNPPCAAKVNAGGRPQGGTIDRPCLFGGESLWFGLACV